MTRHSLLVLFCTALLGIAATRMPAAEPSPLWNGTFKLNPAKSQETGRSFSITQEGSGYRLTNGSFINYTFACDGKTYPTFATYRMRCTMPRPNTMDEEDLFNGAVMEKEHSVVSADGKTMTTIDTRISPQGKTSTSTETYERTSPGSGMIGTWKNVKIKSNSPEILKYIVNADGITMLYPEDGETIKAKRDGSEAKITGPTIPPDAVVRLRFNSPTELHTQAVYQGKAFAESDLKLSADGRTVTEVSWPTGHEDQKVTLVYEKQ